MKSARVRFCMPLGESDCFQMLLAAAGLNLSRSLKFLPCDPDQHREPQRNNPRNMSPCFLQHASAESAVDVVSLRFLRAYPRLLWLIWSGEMPRNMLGHSWEPKTEN